MMSNPGNRITQGQFSFLPDLSDAQISAQIAYALKHNWAVRGGESDELHRRNSYGGMYGSAVCDLKDPAGMLAEINACRKTFPQHYIRVTAFDSRRGVESLAMSYLVNRPDREPGLGLVRQEVAGRNIRYTVQPYATDRPEGERY